MVDVAGRILFSVPKHIVRTAFALSSSLVPMCCEGTLFTYTLYPLLLFLYANINYSSIYLLYRTLLWRSQKFKILIIRYAGGRLCIPCLSCRYDHLLKLLLKILAPESSVCWWYLYQVLLTSWFGSTLLVLTTPNSGWLASLWPRSSPVLNQGLAIPCRVAMWVMSYKEKKKIWYTKKKC